MKKVNKKIMISIFVFILIILLSVSIILASNAISTTNFEINKEKIYYEIKYFDNQIISMSNLLNKKESEINWKHVEKETYNLYNYWNTVILDLNYLDIDKKYLTDFGKNLDNLVISIKYQSKNNSFNNLIKLYTNLTKYAEKINYSNYHNVILTKYNLLLAYLSIEIQNWTLAHEYILNATENMNKVITFMESNQYSQYNIHQAYVAIRELENIINVKDIDVFMYKYNNAINKLENLQS